MKKCPKCGSIRAILDGPNDRCLCGQDLRDVEERHAVAVALQNWKVLAEDRNNRGEGS